MKSLSRKIKESLIQEELDSNIFWMLDKWLEFDDIIRTEFYEIVNKFIGKPINRNDLIVELEYTKLKNNINKLVDFLYNNVDQSEINEFDYIDRFLEIIKQVIYRQKIKGV